MAEKQYISIIRLFEHLDIDYTGEPDINRIKKHLAAEFNQSKTGFIEIDEYTYNRNDVMAEIESPDLKTRLGYHTLIWKDPFLLDMLERNETNLPEVKEALNKLRGDPVFYEFFSPYFAGPFNNVARNCINNSNLVELGEALYLEIFLLPGERESAFTAIRIFLDESLRTFRNVSKENYKTFRPGLEPWRTWGWHKFLNNLPHEFYHYKDQIATDLVNLTVTIQKLSKDDCRDISNDLMLVKDLSEDLQKIIINNDKAFSGSSSSSSGSGNYWWGGIVIFILLRIIASGGCN